jgi:hypothetical protein
MPTMKPVKTVSGMDISTHKLPSDSGPLGGGGVVDMVFVLFDQKINTEIRTKVVLHKYSEGGRE